MVYFLLFIIVLCVGNIFIFRFVGIIKIVIKLLWWLVVIIVFFFWNFFKRIELSDGKLMMLMLFVFFIVVLYEVNFIWRGSLFIIFCKWYCFVLVKGLKVVLKFKGSFIEFFVLLWNLYFKNFICFILIVFLSFKMFFVFICSWGGLLWIIWMNLKLLEV